MCGRFSLLDLEQAAKRFNVTNQPPLFADNYNIAPSVEIPIVQAHSPNQMHLVRWGYHPRWAKNDSMLLINAQAESAATKATWKKAFRESRCIIPASGFFEWKDKQHPYYFTQTDENLFGFAGLIVGEEKNRGVVILTSKANELMAPLHHRQPVILRPETEDDWVNPDTSDQDELSHIIDQQLRANELKKIPVSTAVNSVKNNSSELIEPAPSQDALL